LVQAQRDDFFTEWTTALPTLTAPELADVERIKQRYDYHRADGLLLEGTINLVVTAPLIGTDRVCRFALSSEVALWHWAGTGRAGRNDPRAFCVFKAWREC
jgi:hypothetical protein